MLSMPCAPLSSAARGCTPSGGRFWFCFSSLLCSCPFRWPSSPGRFAAPKPPARSCTANRAQMKRASPAKRNRPQKSPKQNRLGLLFLRVDLGIDSRSHLLQLSQSLVGLLSVGAVRVQLDLLLIGFHRH